MTIVQKNNGMKIVPKIVSDYNFTMGGIDKADQNLKYYSTTRSRGKKYYYKIFIHLLDQAVWNAYILHKKGGRIMTHLQFRLELIDKLIEKYHKEVQSPSKGGRPSSSPTPLRLTERHFIDNIPPTANKAKLYRLCVMCCSKRISGKKVRKETRYYCPDCDVGLCIPCFKTYHTRTNY